MSTPQALKYAKSHEWLKDDGDGAVTVGISDHAQEELGDVVYVELPEVGRELAAGEVFGVIESVKAASDVYAPVAGVVVAVNEALENAPELINGSPYDEGWLMKVERADSRETASLMDAAAYEAFVEAEG